MAQNELVEYISSQLKLGVSRDAIKAALVGAGWAAADVEGALKEAGGGGSATVSPAPVTGSPASKVFPATIGGAKSAEPQTIRVSDLISAAGSAGATVVAAKSGDLSEAAGKAAQAEKGKSGGIFGRRAQPAESAPLDLGGPAAGMAGAGAKPRSAGGRILTVVFAVLFLGAGGFAGYLYFQNNGLAAKVASLGGESANVSAQVSSLNDQVSALTASNTALTAQADSMSAENTELLMELSFVGLPSSSAPGSATAEDVTVAGTLSKSKTAYVLLTQYGVSVYVQNSTNAAVAAALKPLVGSSTVTLAGTHVPGSAYLTVTAVDGSPVGNQSSTPSQSP